MGRRRLADVCAPPSCCFHATCPPPPPPTPPLARRPECKLFIANSLCCMDYGIIQHASVRLWLVCTADVYLPEPKCLTGETGPRPSGGGCLNSWHSPCAPLCTPWRPPAPAPVPGCCARASPAASPCSGTTTGLGVGVPSSMQRRRVLQACPGPPAAAPPPGPLHAPPPPQPPTPNPPHTRPPPPRPQ